MKTSVLIIILTTLTAGGFASPDKKHIQITITDTQNGLSDMAEIYMDNGITVNYIKQEDIAKDFSATSRPLIYSYTADNVPCYSNGFGTFTQTTNVALGLTTATAGSFEISAVLASFDPTSLILLEDKTAGVTIDLRKTKYTINLTQAAVLNERFVIHFTYPATIETVDAGCTNADGAINISQDNSTTVWNSVMLLSASDSLLQTINNASGNFSFTDVEAGYYKVAFQYDNYSAVKNLEVEGHRILLHITTSAPSTVVGETIRFFSNTINVDNYRWDLGDNSIITGVANPEFSYFQPGNYTVTLHASNDHNCSAEASLTVDVASITGIPNTQNGLFVIVIDQKDIIVSTTNYLEGEYSYEIYNISGQMLQTNQLTSASTTINMNNQASGMYVMNIRNYKGASFTKKIFIQ